MKVEHGRSLTYKRHSRMDGKTGLVVVVGYSRLREREFESQHRMLGSWGLFESICSKTGLEGIDWAVCDQIGLFLKVVADGFSYKSSPSVCLGLF